VHSLRDECHFSDFRPKLRDEWLDSSRASRTQAIFVDLCPYRRDEFVDSLRDECHFSDFCPILRDEFRNSSRRALRNNQVCDPEPGRVVWSEKRGRCCAPTWFPYMGSC
jgi:hypothetical protein